MYLSNYFLPVLKEIPSEAKIASHRLMLRAGLVRQESAGIYSWLPFGFSVLTKIANIIRSEQKRAGAFEILMPTIQSAEIWQKSGRYDGYGLEMLRITDRHKRALLYGPTNEEMMTEIFHTYCHSYKDLPKLFYHIQWKFRDEIRPRFGVMRGREFLMKDTYSFDLDKARAQISYQKMFVSYLRTFSRLGLKVVPMKADTGPIGGDLSHEFLILAKTGESQIYCDSNLLDYDWSKEIDYNQDLSSIVQTYTKHYAVTDELYSKAEFEANIPKERRISTRGIEVGHIFYFGDKYTKSMNRFIMDSNDKKVFPHMGSYGIGVSRLVGAIIEASHDDKGIIWPSSIAPFHIGIINLNVEDEKTRALCERAYQFFSNAGLDVLYDDRHERAGVKFSTMDLIGLPYQLIIGPKGIKKGVVEVKKRSLDEERFEFEFEEALNMIYAELKHEKTINNRD